MAFGLKFVGRFAGHEVDGGASGRVGRWDLQRE